MLCSFSCRLGMFNMRGSIHTIQNTKCFYKLGKMDKNANKIVIKWVYNTLLPNNSRFSSFDLFVEICKDSNLCILGNQRSAIWAGCRSQVSNLPVLPKCQFSIHLITQVPLAFQGLMAAWLYIKPTQVKYPQILYSSQPTGDPVDSDHFTESPLQAADGLIQVGF